MNEDQPKCSIDDGSTVIVLITFKYSMSNIQIDCKSMSKVVIIVHTLPTPNRLWLQIVYQTMETERNP